MQEDYEEQHALLEQLQVPDMPKKHWSVGCGWEIAVSMADVLADHTEKAISDAPFFSILADEGSRSGVTKQLKTKHASFMLEIHCMAYRTNLAVQPISNLFIVAKLESLCQAMYAYFSASPKKRLEFQKLADLMETKGLKMLRNVKTWWISLLDPLRRVLGEYKTLIAKMCEVAAVKEPRMTSRQAAARDSARLNYELLCDVGTLLALPCIMPMLECMNLLMQFSQSTHVFVCDYVAAVKITQAKLYVDPDSFFQPSRFQHFCDVVNDHSYTIS